MRNRQREIKQRNYTTSSQQQVSLDFNKIKIGKQTINDVVYDIRGPFERTCSKYSKEAILRYIYQNNYAEMREVSSYFYRVSGIYQRLCRYMAYLYNYDWIITPHINDDKKLDKALLDFDKALYKLDNFGLKKYFGETALKVIMNGCYYGYIIETDQSAAVQELDPRYCRTRFEHQGRPVIEFQMRYFDTHFKDINQRMKILKLFPDDFRKGYLAYKRGALPPLFEGDTDGWYVLDYDHAFKFNLNGHDYPMMISVIPDILDLDSAKGIERQRLAQKIARLIIQKLPLDKNGDMIFDMDESRDIHTNAAEMVSKIIGVDVLTTFADVSVESMAENSDNATDGIMERQKQAIYDDSGISQLQFNSDNSVSVQYSINNDEAAMYNLLIQFEEFIEMLLKPYNKGIKKYYFTANILRTTIYNYKELSKMYKEQMQVGFSKMLPQIALGQSQSDILAAAYFENNVLDLVNVFIPPLMSSTMNADALERHNDIRGKAATKTSTTDDENAGGRPTNESQGQPVSEKTLANRESQQ